MRGYLHVRARALQLCVCSFLHAFLHVHVHVCDGACDGACDCVCATMRACVHVLACMRMYRLFAGSQSSFDSALGHSPPRQPPQLLKNEGVIVGPELQLFNDYITEWEADTVYEARSGTDGFISLGVTAVPGRTGVVTTRPLILARAHEGFARLHMNVQCTPSGTVRVAVLVGAAHFLVGSAEFNSTSTRLFAPLIGSTGTNIVLQGPHGSANCADIVPTCPHHFRYLFRLSCDATVWAWDAMRVCGRLTVILDGCWASSFSFDFGATRGGTCALSDGGVLK